MAKKRTTKQATPKPDSIGPANWSDWEAAEVNLDLIDPHPQNPGRHRITPAGIKERADDIEAHGQLQPILLRPVGKRYQIVFGEYRYHACLMLRSRKSDGRRTIAARIAPADLTDAQVLELQAVENGQREEIDPISQAQHLADMTAAGLTQKQAGAAYGLTQAAVSNSIRLLRLPDSARQAVISGEMPAKIARSMVPYAAAPTVVDQMVDGYKKDHGRNATDWDKEGWQDGQLRHTLTQIAQDATRPMDKVTTAYTDNGRTKRLFKDKDAEGLAVVELPVGAYNHKKKAHDTIPCTVQVADWDKLNKPLQGKNGKPKAKPAKDMSKAEQTADTKRKAKERQEYRKREDRKMAIRLLRAGIADHLVANRDAWQAHYVWLALAAQQNISYRGYRGADLTQVLNVAAWQREGKPSKLAAGSRWSTGNERALFERLLKFGNDDGDEVTAGGELVAHAAALICWPQSDHAKGKNLDWIDDKTPARDKDLPSIPDSLVVRIAEFLQVDSRQQWWVAHGRLASPQRDIVAQFVAYLRKDELEKLCKELTVKPVGKTTKQLQQFVLDTLKAAGSELPLPKCLAIKMKAAPKAKAGRPAKKTAKAVKPAAQRKTAKKRSR